MMELAQLRGNWLGRIGHIPENGLRLLDEHADLAQQLEQAERATYDYAQDRDAWEARARAAEQRIKELEGER
jgi:hypothetical protein